MLYLLLLIIQILSRPPILYLVVMDSVLGEDHGGLGFGSKVFNDVFTKVRVG